MTSDSLHVIRPGLYTTVQDLGRWGYQSMGVSVAGPMDPFSHRLANALVGNPRDAAALEVTLAGPELEFEHERLVVVTGAEVDLTVDGDHVPCGRPFVAPSHARLHVGERRRGARAYLAVEGGLDVPLVLGSRATHVASGLGGWRGRPLERGDRLPLGASRETRARRFKPFLEDLQRKDLNRVRVLPGPHQDRFTSDALDLLCSAPYAVENESDRMGFRLVGPRLLHTRGADLISEPTPMGSLQVPASGLPMLLMADRQTCGGYPRIGTVITADFRIVGQAAPGDRLSFETCTLEEAWSAMLRSEQTLLAIEAAAS